MHAIIFQRFPTLFSYSSKIDLLKQNNQVVSWVFLMVLLFVINTYMYINIQIFLYYKILFLALHKFVYNVAVQKYQVSIYRYIKNSRVS